MGGTGTLSRLYLFNGPHGQEVKLEARKLDWCIRQASNFDVGLNKRHLCIRHQALLINLWKWCGWLNYLIANVTADVAFNNPFVCAFCDFITAKDYDNWQSSCSYASHSVVPIVIWGHAHQTCTVSIIINKAATFRLSLKSFDLPSLVYRKDP